MYGSVCSPGCASVSLTRFQEHQIKNLSYDSTQQMAAINGSAIYAGESTTVGEKL